MLVASDLSAKIIAALQGIDKPAQAGTAFGNAVFDYIAQNVEASYSWTAASSTTPPVTDPAVVCNYKGASPPASPYVHPSGATTPDAAFSALNAALNAAAATMTLTLVDKTFAVNPVLIIPSINVSPSGLDKQKGAMDLLATQIIAGITSATPTITGNHAGVYFGGGAFVKIF